MRESVGMDTQAREVPDDVFADILAQITDFVRTRVMPRETEIMDTDAIPEDPSAGGGNGPVRLPCNGGVDSASTSSGRRGAMELGYLVGAAVDVRHEQRHRGQVLVGFGTDEQKRQWLPHIASGEVCSSFALTNGAGSNPRVCSPPRPPTERLGHRRRKQFITNATEAGLFVVFARMRPAPDPGNDIAVFLVPGDAPGVQVGAHDTKMGQEGSRTAEVTFSRVRVGPEALVGADGGIGYRAAMTSLARGRIHIAGLAVGCAQRALDESVSYAASATQGGTVIGDFQLVQAMLADQQTGVLAAVPCLTPPASTSVARTGVSRPRQQALLPRWRVRRPISPSRCTVAPVMRGVPVERSTATSACCVCTRAPARSSV